MIKRILTILIILSAATSLYGEDLWTIRTGLNFTPGLVFNRAWDPGYNGTASSTSVEYQNDDYFLGCGIEAGYNFTGFNLLFPVLAGLTIAGDEIIQFAAYASVMPGMILSRPFPYFLMAAELGARLTWAVNQDFNLLLSAGPRYTASPDYSTEVAPLEFIDLSLGLSASFRI
jgi:hypothetical protein